MCCFMQRGSFGGRMNEIIIFCDFVFFLFFFFSRNDCFEWSIGHICHFCGIESTRRTKGQSLRFSSLLY